MNTVARTGQRAPTIGSSEPILAFVCDEETLETVVRVVPGGRRGVEVREGGVQVALSALQQGACPELLIVDLSESSSPIPDISNLAAVAGPETTIVAIGQENDVSLYRALLNTGVTDYLVKPITGQELRRTILAAGRTEEQEAVSANGRTVFVMGARGGVGATNVAIGVASLLADEFHKQVGLVDLDLHFGTIALSLDLEASNGLRNALENADRIDSLFVASALVNKTENLFVLGGEEPLDTAFDLQQDALELLLSELRRIFDVVVVDIPRYLVPEVIGTVSAADRVVIVSDLSIAGLRDMVRLRSGLQNLSPDIAVTTVVNRAGLEKAGEISQQDFEKGFDAKLDFVIPEDPRGAKASVEGRPLIQALKGSSFETFRALARTVAGIEEDRRKRGWFSRS
ncbi:MAG: AAA family ATPase [Rhodospirillaceae bacterium]|nr:AAA family ATPase [Rhodospirillaceae bacterium]